MVEEDFGDYEENEEDLGRRERRRMYLSGLHNLVPKLKHATPVQTLSSGHFSLLQVRERGDKMPFLNEEVFDQVAQSGVKQKKAGQETGLKQKDCSLVSHNGTSRKWGVSNKVCA